MRLLLFLLVASLPQTTSADTLSFLLGIFGGGSAEASSLSSPADNSQTIPLLAAAVSADAQSARGGGDITIDGGVALLPESGPSGTPADIGNGLSNDQISIYVVRRGDTLSEVADMFGVSVNTIIWANDLSNARDVRPGQTLVILPVSGIRHVVAPGETVESIARRYKADPKEIVQFNDLPGGALAAGTAVIIPDGEMALPESYYSSAAYPTEKLRHAGGPVYEHYYAAPLASFVKTQGLHGYNAVDLGAPIGTPIMASAPGEVIVSKNYGWNGGYGEYVVIAHNNGTETLYAHMSKNITYVGMRVFQGQVIGYVGVTGKTTGPHLHFEVRGATNPFGP